MSSQSPTSARVEQLRDSLLAFFDSRARDLPWRRTEDPYAIWISEVMLQQTRVETVIPYWESWLERFPTIDALAAATEDEVLKEWEGLGYYSRARNLHRGAQVVRERFRGELPTSKAELLEVPGIGPYTSGAVASIAFGEAVPAVDGNVKRVFARLFDDPAPSAKRLEEWAAQLVDRARPGDFNQALMELGATVCVPRSPKCTECPVRMQCAAHAAGTVSERPAPKAKKRVPEADFIVRVSQNAAGEILLERRGPGLLQGMWSFPEERLPDGRGLGGGPGGVEGVEGVAEADKSESYIGRVDHVFTHLRARYHVWMPQTVTSSRDGGGGTDVSTNDARGVESSQGKETRWVSMDRTDELALPTGQKKILELVRRHLAGPYSGQ